MRAILHHTLHCNAFVALRTSIFNLVLLQKCTLEAWMYPCLDKCSFHFISNGANQLLCISNGLFYVSHSSHLFISVRYSLPVMGIVCVELRKQTKVTNLKEQCNILGDSLISFLAWTQIRRLVLLSCQYEQYEATVSR